MGIRKLGDLTVGNGAQIAANNAGAQLKNGAGTLIAVTVTSPGTAWVITFYDGTSTGGRVIAVFTGAGSGTYLLFAPFDNGLFYVASGTTPGSVTVITDT